MEGNALTPEQLQAIIAAAAAVRDAERREKEGAVEKAVIPRLKHNPDQQDTAIRPWPGCPYSLPRDVVELFRRGSQPPLIWLTYEGILDAGRRRQPLVFPLDKRSQEDVNDALARDTLLPRTSVLSALGALAVLFRTFQDEDDVGEDEQDPATLIEELSLSISARASDEHWGLWRQYVRNVLGKIWEPRRDGDLDFDVGKIEPNLLRMTEEAASVPQGRAEDHANDGKNFVTFLLTAKREEAEAAARQYEKVLQGLLFGPFIAQAGTSSIYNDGATRGGSNSSAVGPFKRKAVGLQPFRSASSSGASRGDGGSFQRVTGHALGGGTGERRQEHFCTACLRSDAGHDFRVCPKAHSDKLRSIPPHGWRWDGKTLCLCNRFNLGLECISSADKCSFGHYCSCYGKDGCRAIACPEL
ncbi:hypothetical protein V8E36_009852 [Tilletia maclaganii]